MKAIRIIKQLAILASMGLTSCQEYEAGFTAVDIFRGTYARKFVEKHGAIDPDANNISIYVYWDGSNATKLENPTSIDGGSKVWTSTFPKRGTVPYIIATNIDDDYTGECQDISETSWWQSHFRWSSPTAKQ